MPDYSQGSPHRRVKEIIKLLGRKDKQPTAPWFPLTGLNKLSASYPSTIFSNIVLELPQRFQLCNKPGNLRRRTFY